MNSESQTRTIHPNRRHNWVRATGVALGLTAAAAFGESYYNDNPVLPMVGTTALVADVVLLCAAGAIRERDQEFDRFLDDCTNSGQTR